MLFSLDLRTILFTSMLVNIVLAVAMLVYWRTQKTYSGFGYMACANVLFALTFLFFAFRGVIPEIVSIVGANFLAVLSAAFRLEGIRHFIGASRIIRRNFIVAVLFAVLLALISAHYAGAPDGLYIRTLLITIAVLYFAGSIARAAMTVNDPRDLLLMRIIAVLHIGYCLILVIRTGVWVASPDERVFFAASLVNLAFFLYDLLNHIGLAVIYMMLNSRRLESHLNDAQKSLEILATKDSLTELYNNRTFCEMGQAELLRSKRLNHPLALLMLDVDYFKNVNDTFGHAAGDKVLKEVSQTALRLARGIDVIARMGGDEFVMLLPETTIEQAQHVAERLRGGVEQTVCDWDSVKIKITVSIGLVELSPSDLNFEMLLRRSDDALYEAKRCGRNKVVAR